MRSACTCPPAPPRCRRPRSCSPCRRDSPGARVRIMCTPPRADGTRRSGACSSRRASAASTAVYKVGGAQAIAAMAYGTADRAASRQDLRSGQRAGSRPPSSSSPPTRPAPAIDLPAGPSEVLVIADDGARADFVAADLLAQAEHSCRCAGRAGHRFPAPGARMYRGGRAAARRPAASRDRERGRSPAAASSSCRTCDTALEVANDTHPSTSSCRSRRPRRWLAEVRNAGSVFLGAWTPETLGDYCSGTNHVLPTDGHARALQRPRPVRLRQADHGAGGHRRRPARRSGLSRSRWRGSRGSRRTHAR